MIYYTIIYYVAFDYVLLVYIKIFSKFLWMIKVGYSYESAYLPGEYQ